MVRYATVSITFEGDPEPVVLDVPDTLLVDNPKRDGWLTLAWWIELAYGVDVSGLEPKEMDVL